MNKSLKNNLLAAVAGGALVIATLLIQHFEGVEYTPYYDVVGVLTVCYGHTGKDIIEDKTYSQTECDALFKQDLAIVKKQVDSLITVDLPDHTLAALYSFVYNVGVGNFSKSTLLKKINTNDPTACDELKRWIYAGGVTWNGLINRREAEHWVCEVYQ